MKPKLQNTPKYLAKSIASIMMLMSLGTPIALNASDTEIYQRGTEGVTTLMLQIDLSGSMNIGSVFEDYRAVRMAEAGDTTKITTENKGGAHGMVTSRFENKISQEQIKEDSSPGYDKIYAYNQKKLRTDTVNGVPVEYFRVLDTDENLKANIKYNSTATNTTNLPAKNYKQCDYYPGTSPEYRCYTRLSRMKMAFIEVLSKKNANNEYVLDDNKAIGLSLYSDEGAGLQGYIAVPARKLGEKIGDKTHRDILIEKFKSLSGSGGTPTGAAYAETMAYMFGTSVNDGIQREYFGRNESTGKDILCTVFNADGITCKGNFDTNHKFPKGFKLGKPGQLFSGGTEMYLSIYKGGFESSVAESKKGDNYKQPDSLANQKSLTSEQKKCHGQGIYVLTDGIPNTNYLAHIMTKSALGSSHGSQLKCTADGVGWDCMHKAAELLKNGNNPTGLEIKTAVVGFGADFDGVPSYNASLTLDESLKIITDTKVAFTSPRQEQVEELKKKIKELDPNADIAKLKITRGLEGEIGKLVGDLNRLEGDIDLFENVTQAASWGIKGGGGWYAGSSSTSIIKSINDFIAQLQKDIPTTVTGQPFIPIDPLNRLTYMRDAYYGAFSPLVGQQKTFWSGDINKYGVKNQLLYGQDGTTRLFDNQGILSPATLGYWGNGASSLLPVQATGDTTNRKVFTNLDATANTLLQNVTLKSLYPSGGSAYKANLAGTDNAYLNSWLNILGYSIKVDSSSEPTQETDLQKQPELKQLGALLHSTPIILTQSMTGSPVNPTTRQDYILYGSTQGILHVIDSATGVEKVAFVPNEMMTNSDSRTSFQHVNNASASTVADSLTYGVDGQWTAYTQYVPDAGGYTVNKSTDASSSFISGLSGKGVQWVYGGLRMGGRSYYALDLSNLDAPKLKFHIDPSTAAAGSPLSYMGQSWSKPVLGFVNWKNATGKKERRLVMFVGGGYDAGYENRTYPQTNGVGAGVYMFDAHNGELLWWGSSHANTDTKTTYTNNSHLKYSVVSQISTLDVNNDGLVDNLFFGDLGGQVFRVDFDNNHADTDNLATRIVRLYNGNQAGGLSPRFYEAPSFSVHSGAGATGKFGVVSIASGNRSSPLALDAESAQDALFVLYDHDTLKAGNHKKGVTQTTTNGTLATLTAKDVKDNAGKSLKDFKTFAVINQQAQTGWKYPFGTKPGALKGFSSPRVVDNLLFVNTYTPTKNKPQNCAAGTVGESYQEVFCLPSGICSAERHTLLGGGAIPKDADTGNAGSIYRFKTGNGNVQTAVGDAGSKTNEQIVSTVSPYTDCSNPVACLKEVSSISNKLVRWYEDKPEIK